jgi:hypothetical protein
MLNKFDFITDYKYYGRPRLNEDELDDALGLSAENPQPDAQQSDTPTDQSATPNDPNAAPVDQETENPDASATDAPAAPAEAGGDDGEIEVDMTQLVLKQQETATAVQDLLQKIDTLVKNSANIKTDVEQQLQQFQTKNADSVDKLKQEIQMRTPTPLEKMQLRSMSSFPYNIKLSDYWMPTQEDRYKYSIANAKTDVNNDPTFTVKSENLPDVQKTPQEFVLKQSEIMKGYDENFVKKSF